MNNSLNYRALIEEAMSETTEYVTVETDGPLAVVEMNDPRRYNSLTAALTHQLRERLESLTVNPDIRVVILTGVDPAFSSGGDLHLIQSAQRALREGNEGAATMWQWIRRQFGGVVRTLTQTDKIFIAAVNGPAAGVGLAFALACDFIIASDRARLVTAFGKLGLVPEVGTSWLLTRRLGYHKAFEVFVSGDNLTGAEAERLGLVNKVVPHDDLMEEARKWADRVSALPQTVTAMSKTLLRKASDMTWEQALVMEEFAEPICFTTQDHRSAVEKMISDLSRKNARHA